MKGATRKKVMPSVRMDINNPGDLFDKTLFVTVEDAGTIQLSINDPAIAKHIETIQLFAEELVRYIGHSVDKRTIPMTGAKYRMSDFEIKE